MPRHARLCEAGRCNRTTAGIWGSAGAPRGGNRLKTAILQQPYREGRNEFNLTPLRRRPRTNLWKKGRGFSVRSPRSAPRRKRPAFLARRRERHYDARHTVYAYILREGNREKYSDDGEPQGTGGQPVLEVIRRAGLTDVCVAVTRYFGGILLGAGRTDPRLCQWRGAGRRGGGTDHLPLLRRLPDRDGLSAVRAGEQAAARLWGAGARLLLWRAG